MRSLRRPRALFLLALALALAASVWSVVGEPIERETSPLLVNDVTQLNPIAVGAVITPTETHEIVEAVKRSGGPIAVGGARHSMGGQIATAGALHIDMRRFDKILDFSPAEKTIRVQAGARWRQIQERIDASNLSVAIMQSYANFTVGGSLSVNVHGRYVGLGPIILSVKSLKVVLADGSLVEASPGQNADIFNGVILAVLKGNSRDTSGPSAAGVRVRLGYYRYDWDQWRRDHAPQPGLPPPGIVNTGSTLNFTAGEGPYLLFLARGSDGLYAPVSGHTFPTDSVYLLRKLGRPAG